MFALQRHPDVAGGDAAGGTGPGRTPCIMISGPQTKAAVLAGSKSARSISSLTKPTCPCQPARGPVDGDLARQRHARRQSRARARRSDRPVNALRRAGRSGRTARAPRARAAPPAAAARGRSRRPPPRRPARSAPATSQSVPYGPRTPITCPGPAAHSARVTAPTDADGLGEQACAGAPIPADRDGHLADAERVQHGELARLAGGDGLRPPAPWPGSPCRASPRAALTRYRDGHRRPSSARRLRPAPIDVEQPDPGGVQRCGRRP